MKLLLAIETSSDEYRIVLGCDGKPIFDSVQDWDLAPSKNLAELVSGGLRLVGAQVSDITCVTLNIGPGGLSYIRAGASFANALAFSLGIGLYPFNYFKIVARQAQKYTELPVLCAFPAANGHAYVGLINAASVKIMRYGLLPAVVAEISNGLTEVAVAGRIRHHLSSLLDGVKVVDTGIERPNPIALLELGYQAYEQGKPAAAQVSPLNDQSEAFYE